MAYVFFSPNKQGVISIAANDADKSQIAGHYLSGSFVEEIISDDDFTKLRQGTWAYDCSQNPPVLYETQTGYEKQQGLDDYIAFNLIQPIDVYLENWKGSANYDQWSAYKTQLQNLDTSSLTYPMTVPLEKYFADQGQPYYSVLELP